MFIEDEAIKGVVAISHLTEDEIKKAIEIYYIYQRQLQSLKDKRQMFHQQALKEYEIIKKEQERPNQCFCREKGLNIIHNPDKDELICYITMRDWRNPTNPYEEPIYKCSNCGKQYMISVGIA